MYPRVLHFLYDHSGNNISKSDLFRDYLIFIGIIFFKCMFTIGNKSQENIYFNISLGIFLCTAVTAG